MLTLVHVPRSRRSSAQTTALVAAYLSFDRQRRDARPYIQVFAGFAVLVLLGAAAGNLPRFESMIAATLFMIPVCVLLGVNVWRRSQLERRADAIWAEIREPIHKKVIKTA